MSGFAPNEFSGPGELATLDAVDVVLQAVPNLRRELGEVPGVLGEEVLEQAEDVVPDLDFTVAADAGADPDGGDAQLGGDLLAQGGGDGFQHDREGASALQGAGVVQHLGGGGVGFALHLVSTELLDGLGREAEVPHDGDTGGDESLDDAGDAFAALQLDGGRAALLEETDGVAHRLVLVGLVGAEGHIGNDEGALGAAHDGLGVMDDFVHGDGHGGVVAQDDHAQGIANEDAGNTGLIDETGAGVVVAGDHGETLAAILECAQAVDGASGHGGGPPPTRNRRRRQMRRQRKRSRESAANVSRRLLSCQSTGVPGARASRRSRLAATINGTTGPGGDSGQPGQRRGLANAAYDRPTESGGRHGAQQREQGGGATEVGVVAAGGEDEDGVTIGGGVGGGARRGRCRRRP